MAAGKAWVKSKVDKGKAWAKEKARAVREALGLIKKPFTAGRSQHTLSVDLKTGAITMASREAPIRVAIEREIASVNDRRRRAGLEPLPRDQILTNVLPQIAAARQAIAMASGDRADRTRVAQSQLDRLAGVVENLLSQIGGDIEQADGSAPAGLGRVARHSDNSGAVPRDPRRPWFALESEHVIPVSLVSALFHALGDDVPIARPGPEDNEQHTILVYKGAANRKTTGHPNGDVKFGLADSDVIGHTKSILATGGPNIAGSSRSRVAKGHRELTASERAERERTWAQIPPDQVARVLQDTLPDRMAERVDDLVTAIEADHREFGARRRENVPAPDAAKVRAAAMLQVQEIVQIFVRRLRQRGR